MIGEEKITTVQLQKSNDYNRNNPSSYLNRPINSLPRNQLLKGMTDKGFISSTTGGSDCTHQSALLFLGTTRQMDAPPLLPIKRLKDKTTKGNTLYILLYLPGRDSIPCCDAFRGLSPSFSA